MVVTASTLLASQPAQASTPVENHCITFGGIDLNQFYGVSEQLVAPGCSQIGSGEPYRVWAGWWMNSSFAAVPSEFVPAGDTPLEDFVAKFVAVKYVVDPGTAQEKTYIVPNRGQLWTGILFGLPHVNTLTLGVLKPLPVGQHDDAVGAPDGRQAMGDDDGRAIGLQQILGFDDKERARVVTDLTDVLERSRRM